MSRDQTPDADRSLDRIADALWEIYHVLANIEEHMSKQAELRAMFTRHEEGDAK